MLIASEVMKCSLPFNNCNSMIVTLFAICFNWPSPWKRYFVKKIIQNLVKVPLYLYTNYDYINQNILKCCILYFLPKVCRSMIRNMVRIWIWLKYGGVENREAVNHPQMAIAASVLCDENTAHCELFTFYSAVYVYFP